MKQKDIALIAVVAIVSAVLSIFISNALFGGPKNRQEKVEIVDAISTDFQKPSNKYFNSNAINPTRLIKIGDDPNPKPFND